MESKHAGVDADFYARLPVLAASADVMDPDRYCALPDEWLIGLTDVVASTQAVADGR